METETTNDMSGYIYDGLINQTIKECSCGALIEKNDGCNYLQCSFCHQEWCWVCWRIKGTLGCPFGSSHNSH